MLQRRRSIVSLACAGALACGAAIAAVATAGSGGQPPALPRASLAAASCGGPAGAAYVADPGYQGFTAVDTANCEVVTTYNVDDQPVPSQPSSLNYDGSDESVALSGTTLWFAVTGTDDVAAIDTTALDPSNYSPPEKVIPVGFMPESVAASPDGTQVWVVDSGPQTSTSRLWGIDVISTSSDQVVRRLDQVGDPTDVAFSPDGSRAYVTTSDGLSVYDTRTDRIIAFVPGLGSPKSVAVGPDGSKVYVTETNTGRLATISAATNRVVRVTAVGQEPWQAAVSPSGATVYVADPNSDSVSVVDASNGRVDRTITVAGAPDTLAVTPDGSQLWVAGVDSGILTVIDTASGDIVGSTNLGGDGANSGDGLDPTGIVLTATPTAGG